MTRKARLLFHSPCFDGIVSAVIAADYLCRGAQWGELEIADVNYDIQKIWLSTRFEARTAVVDFLYHPDAAFWADHHRSTFLNDDMRRDFARRSDRHIVYDHQADSCAGLLWRHLHATASYRNPHFAELVLWAEKIDAARYESVEEALSFEHPALQISASMALSTNGYSEFLVRALSEQSLEEVSMLPEVRERFLEFRRATREGLQRMRDAASLRDGIVVFDVDAHDVVVPRYAPYLFFPDARYSVGLVRREDEAKITAMRNPWMEFESVALGDIFTRYGGGGHRRVASVLVAPQGAEMMLERIVSDVTSAERNRS
ncbi:MAG TPA: hypothetical protein VNA69_20380 [Thermoanaerobaculia bacterium]|nr:hypothetical protein [Thermoanaerobaculia bacterium]